MVEMIREEGMIVFVWMGGGPARSTHVRCAAEGRGGEERSEGERSRGEVRRGEEKRRGGEQREGEEG